MSKVLWFSIAILLCSALAECLTCIQCDKYKVDDGCKDGPQTTCVAEPGQKCKIINTFLEGRLQNIVTLGCTDPSEECDETVLHPDIGPTDTVCCDTDLCNVP